MKKYGAVLLLLLLPTATFAQTSDPAFRRSSILDGNNVAITFYNDGQMSGFNPGFDIRGHWDGNYYIGDITPVIGLELPPRDYDGNGSTDTLHPVIICRGPRNRQSEEKHPVFGYFRGFNPVVGFFDTTQQHVALSDEPGSWPDIWPDHPGWGSGVWNGLLGPDLFAANLEAYYQVNDRWDDEFNATGFRPDSADTSIKGYGITMSVRYLQSNHPSFDDGIVRVYDIINTSSYRYEKVFLGSVVGTLSGGDGDSQDDLSFIDTSLNMVYFWDSDGRGNAGQKVGYVGETILEGPSDRTIGSYSCFNVSAAPAMDDDEMLWSKFTPGQIDSIQRQPQDGDFLFGTRYFSMAPGETMRVAIATVFAYTKSELDGKTRDVSLLWHAGFDTNRVFHSVSFDNPGHHRVLRGIETINWSPAGEGSIDLWYSPDFGESWYPVESNLPNSGSYDLDTRELEDSPFGMLKFYLKDTAGRAFAYATSHDFTVDNDSNGTPFVRIVSPKLVDTSLVKEDSLALSLLVSDAEVNPLTVTVSYSLDAGKTFTGVATYGIVPDTIARSFPVNLSPFQNSDSAVIRIEVSDSVSTSTVHAGFRKQTDRPIIGISDSLIFQGNADAPFAVQIADINQLTGHMYTISFDDTSALVNTWSAGMLRLNVHDATEGLKVIDKETIVPGRESSFFGGLSFVITGVPTVLDTAASHWGETSSTNVSYTFSPFFWTATGPGMALNGYRMPGDYAIIFHDSVVDTSIADTLYPPTPGNTLPARPISFVVKNLITGNNVDVAYFKTGTLSTSFNIFFKETVHERYRHTWRVNLYDIHPGAELPINDTLYLYTRKGLSSYDTITVLGFTTSAEPGPSFPPLFRLHQNYPNPFNPATVIRYSLPVSGYVRLRIYDVLGREVATLVDGVESPGEKFVEWNAAGVASGIYFYRLEATSVADPTKAFTQTRKMLIVR